MALNIPLPDAPDVALGKAFTRGTGLYNMLLQNAINKQKMRQQQEINDMNAKLFPLKQMHLAALTNSAQSNADWNNMLMGKNSSFNMPNANQETNDQQMDYDSVKSKFPLNKNNQPQDNEAFPEIEEEKVLKEGDSSLYNLDKHAGVKGVPPVQTHYDSNGNLISRWPSGKITIQKVGPSAAENKQIELQNISNNKIMDELRKNNISSIKVNSSIDRLDKLVQDPELDEMFDHPIAKFGGELGRKARIEYLKNYGTKSQKDLISRIESKSNEIIADMGNVFKGSFKLFEKETIEKMKPQPWDSPVAQRAKLNELKRAEETQRYINTRIPELIKKEHLNPDEAFVKAYNEINADDFINQMNEKYGTEREKSEIKTNPIQSENKPNKLNEESFATSISQQLIDVIPEATPKNLLDFSKEHKMTIEETAKYFIDLANEKRKSMGNK